MTVKWTGGHFFLHTQRDHSSVEPLDLAFCLFSWDPITQYGTLIRESTLDGELGIEVSALDALRLFGDPPFMNSEADIQWNPDIQGFRLVASVVHLALAGRLCVPDFEQWKQGSLGWKLGRHGVQLLTDKASTAPSDIGHWLTSDVGMNFTNQWLDRAIRDTLTGTYETAASLDISLTAPPLLHLLPTTAFEDEEDWLYALGFQSEDVPFDVCMEVTEPIVDDEPWAIRALLRDKINSDVIHPAPGFESEDDEPCPVLWSKHAGLINGTIRAWTALYPPLGSSEDPTRLVGSMDADGAWAFLVDGVTVLVEAGYTVFVPSWWQELIKRRVRVHATVSVPASSSGPSLFGLAQTVDFDWRIAIGNLEISETEFMALVSKKQRLLRYRDTWIEINPDLVRKFREVTQPTKRRHSLTLREAMEMVLLGESSVDLVSDSAVSGMDSEDDLSVQVELDGVLAEILAQLQSTESMPILETPPGFQGNLRAYQQMGFSWLTFLRRYGLGACLADDMGLGKTVQYTAYLLQSRIAQSVESHPDSRPPSLLISPTSVLGNWQKELERFAPGLRVYVHYGVDRLKDTAFAKAIGDTDLVLTTYSLCHMDLDTLHAVEWDSICLDEAQNIKNPHTKQAAAIRKLNGLHRIAMTGTPIENRLTELWSIFEFTNPGYLGSMNRFVERFSRPIERDGNELRMHQLQRLIAPFLLRRKKEDPAVELDLPEKLEANVYVHLSREQGALYESIVNDMLKKIDTLEPMERRGLILGSLTRLKQVCNHPWLFQREGAFRHEEGRSAKLDRLLEMTRELLSEGDACLIFTQFVEAGRMLQTAIESELGESPLFLHGGLRKAARDNMIADFQEKGESRILILSLKAGGVGLNLTSASHVFHFDRWWNPAVENQATDRAYRIGQTRHVQVHKFVSLGTLEERINQMIEQKRTISDQIVSGGEGWITELSKAELQELFQLRRGIGIGE